MEHVNMLTPLPSQNRLHIYLRHGMWQSAAINLASVEVHIANIESFFCYTHTYGIDSDSKKLEVDHCVKYRRDIT